MSNVPVAPFDGRSFAAAQSFILGTKMWWTGTLYPAMHDAWMERCAARPEPPASAAEAEAILQEDDLYTWFAWLERHLQRMKYSGRYGLQPWHELHREALEADLDPAQLPDGLLQLNPALDLPTGFTETDIHQHPGGIWSDPVAGCVYERGARTTTPLAGAKHRDLHDRLVSWIEDHGGAPNAVVDLGCGFGKSTRPMYQTWREAAVTGVDIAAPCLTLAAADAVTDQARNVRFVQADATETGLPAESADLVTSTMVLHEMPPPDIQQAFTECRRLLKPGGRIVHLDFWSLPDMFHRAIHYGHARRNNEPWMEPWAEMDPIATLNAAGFENVRVEPFEEAEGALDSGNRSWRFPWTVISAEASASPA